MYPMTSLLAAVANRALDALALDDGAALARFARRHVALRVGGKRLVWRIDAQGKLLAGHPLIDADCVIDYKNGAVKISGDGELFAALSAVWRDADWLAAISRMGGDALAPTLLHRLEQGAEFMQERLARALAPADAAATYRRRMGELQSQVARVAARVDSLAAGKER